ncbi:hypothetical protein [Henriciella algicola]|uniref:DUF4062 domain-containing protein n=1 Tax=Henriciella algicola TaxID=1608422 RepID=A0A399RPK3_9PROT|nr:hypothetical protein [Henriciella algicola]RIJ32144.1 hypothetical protein D1222_07935 [Henriciella algicola]
MKVLISYTGDQTASAQIVKQTIGEINDTLSAIGEEITYLDWKENVASGQADEAQAVVNAQAAGCDTIIAIIGCRLGTPTQNFDSGTVEEIEKFLNSAQKQKVSFNIHVFFNTHTNEALQIKPEELKKVQDFQAYLSEKGVLYQQFSDNIRLAKITRTGLSHAISSTIAVFATEEFGVTEALQEFEELGFEDALEISYDNLKTVAEQMEMLGTLARGLTSKLDQIQKRPEPLRQAGLRVDLPNHLDSAALEADHIGSTMAEAASAAYSYASIAFTIALEDGMVSSSSPEVPQLVGSMEQASGSLDGLCEAMATSLKAIESFPRINRTMIRAKKSYITSFSRVLGICETFSSDIRDLARQIQS